MCVSVSVCCCRCVVLEEFCEALLERGGRGEKFGEVGVRLVNGNVCDASSLDERLELGEVRGELGELVPPHPLDVASLGRFRAQ